MLRYDVEKTIMPRDYSIRFRVLRAVFTIFAPWVTIFLRPRTKKIISIFINTILHWATKVPVRPPK